MARKRYNKLIPIDPATVEIVAHILGPSSAAARALKEASEHKGACRFYQSDSSIILQKLPVESVVNEEK